MSLLKTGLENAISQAASNVIGMLLMELPIFFVFVYLRYEELFQEYSLTQITIIGIVVVTLLHRVIDFILLVGFMIHSLIKGVYNLMREKY